MSFAFQIFKYAEFSWRVSSTSPILRDFGSRPFPLPPWLFDALCVSPGFLEGWQRFGPTDSSRIVSLKHGNGKSQLLKVTSLQIVDKWAIFHSYLKLPEGTSYGLVASIFPAKRCFHCSKRKIEFLFRSVVLQKNATKTKSGMGHTQPARGPSLIIWQSKIIQSDVGDAIQLGS